MQYGLRSLLVLGFALLTLLAFNACGGKDEPSDAPAAQAAPAQPAAAAGEHSDHKSEGFKESFEYRCDDNPDKVLPRPHKCTDGSLAKAIPKQDSDVEVEYFCPMHPDETSDDPGRCSQCKMYLSARDKGSSGMQTPDEHDGHDQAKEDHSGHDHP